MQYKSEVIKTNEVSFAEFTGERVYMIPFFQKQGLPKNLQRWQKTVDQMLEGISTEEAIYLMIDQSFVSKGTSQRRPGLHIDGYWNPSSFGHETHGKTSSLSLGGHGGHKSSGGSQKGTHGTGGHKAQKSGGSHGGHRAQRGVHGSSMNQLPWDLASFSEHEGLILASNITAARGFNGLFEGPIKNMGDCAHVDTRNLKEVILDAGSAYVGNVTFLHESLPVQEDCYRTLVRLNVPGLDLKSL